MQNFLKRFKNTYIPKLRFKEFNEKWIIDSVENIFKITRGLVVAKNKIAKEKNSNFPYPVYSSQTQNRGLMGYYSDYLYEDAITWTTDGYAGIVHYRDEKFYCTNVCGVLLKKKYQPNLCIAKIIGKETKKYVIKDLAIPKLMNNVMAKIKIIFPSLIQEQNKISKFIDLLNQQILLLEIKLQLMEQKIKYFLKILLTKKQQNCKIRFKNFNNDLEIKKIYEITTFIKSGGTPKSKNSLYYTDDQGINFLAIPDMKNKYLLKTTKHITKLALENSSTFIFEKNNLLYSIYATIGEICINRIDVALPQSVLGIKVNHLVVKEYLYYLLASNKEKIIKLSQTGSQPNLSLKIFKDIKLLITTDKNEQIKISKFLGILDYQKFLIKRKIKKIKKRNLFYSKKIFI